MIGQHISRYHIIEKLGEGGMGEVYLAQDNELNRKIAIKFLPSQFNKDLEIKNRFKHEAKAAALLSHPNIITVYDVGEYEGKAFIAMEYMDGQSLKDLLSKEELSINRIIDISSQICEGLREAHQAGIFHRDIKPDNILIDSKGRIKIADFGLAKARGRTKLTQEGSTMGTLNYMSPEQLSGANVDQRSDIWSFGVVLYEMITGLTPFNGEYDQAIQYSIMNEEPEPLARYKRGVSQILQHIIDKALDKDKETRYQNIADLLTDLKREKKSSSEITAPIAKVWITKNKRTSLKYAAIVILVILVILIGIKVLNQPPIERLSSSHNQVTFTGETWKPSLSPDGQFLSYYVQKDSTVSLMVQDISGGQPLEILAGLTGVAHYANPALWSPDGSELVLIGELNSKVSIFIVPRLGGEPQVLPVFGAPHAWSPDGSHIAGSFYRSRHIMLTEKTTGDTSKISIKGDFKFFHELDWSPKGDRLLFLTSDKDENYSIWTIKNDGSQQQKIVEDSVMLFSPRWAAQGSAIYYLRQQETGETKDLMKVKISASGAADNSPQRLQTGLEAGELFSLSKDNKHLIYTRESNYSNLWLVTLGFDMKIIETKKLTAGTSKIAGVQASPDGSRLALSYNGNINVMPLQGGQMQQITFFNALSAGPCWSPNGKEIAFGSGQGGKYKVWKIDATGGKPHEFRNSELSKNAPTLNLSWAPGNDIVYLRPGNRIFQILNTKTEEEKQLGSEGWRFNPRASPDNKMIAFAWNRVEKGDTGIWFVTIEDSYERLFYKGNVDVIGWTFNGKWIYGTTTTKPMRILKISTSNGKLENRIELPFDNVDAGITMTPDGKKIVCGVTQYISDAWLMENFDPDIL